MNQFIDILVDIKYHIIVTFICISYLMMLSIFLDELIFFQAFIWEVFLFSSFPFWGDAYLFSYRDLDARSLFTIYYLSLNPIVLYITFSVSWWCLRIHKTTRFSFSLETLLLLYMRIQAHGAVPCVFFWEFMVLPLRLRLLIYLNKCLQVLWTKDSRS